MRTMLALSLALGLTTSAFAQDKPHLLTPREAWWTAGGLAAAIALSSADTRVAAFMNDSAHRSAGLDRFTRGYAKVQEGSLTLGNLAMYGVFRLTGAEALADVTLHAAESVVVGTVALQVVRGSLGRTRPHVTKFKDQYDFGFFKGFREFDHRAFPSLHTSSAFGVATVYVMETQRRAPRATKFVAPLAYTLAAGPGLSRLYAGQHWASDILAGAVMGTVAGALVVRYNHDVRPGNKVDRFMLGREAVSLSFKF